jgi:hypothetical protein
VLYHHERLDGNGFPRGVDHRRLTDSQMLFNLCHNQVEKFHQLQSPWSQFFDYDLDTSLQESLADFKDRFCSLIEAAKR